MFDVLLSNLIPCLQVNYHVVFLDQNVSRAWLNSSYLKKYDEKKIPGEVNMTWDLITRG